MNAAGFAAAVASAVPRRGFSSDEAPAALVDPAISLARSVLARSDMMLTAGEARLMSRSFLRALGISERE